MVTSIIKRTYKVKIEYRVFFFNVPSSDEVINEKIGVPKIPCRSEDLQKVVLDYHRIQ
jgi:hypothetical protein